MWISQHLQEKFDLKDYIKGRRLVIQEIFCFSIRLKRKYNYIDNQTEALGKWTLKLFQESNILMQN